MEAVGICLSGGGSRGFAHLGALKAITELGIKPIKLSGSSAGAVAAALYAQGIPPEESLERLSHLSILGNLKFAFNKFGLFKLSKVEKLLQELIPHDSFEGLKIPIAVCAVDIAKGRAEFFENGEGLAKAITASCAIPGLFEPVRINGIRYIDGGVMNNLPVEPLIDHCATLIGVNVTPFEKRMPVKSAKDVFLKSLYMSIENQTNSKLDSFDIIIEPKKIARYDGLSMKKAKELFTTGYDSTMKRLEKVLDSEKKLQNQKRLSNL